MSTLHDEIKKRLDDIEARYRTFGTCTVSDYDVGFIVTQLREALAELDKTTECLIAEQMIREELQAQLKAANVVEQSMIRLGGEVDALKQERNEYREALERIADDPRVIHVDTCEEIAIEALAKYPKENK